MQESRPLLVAWLGQQRQWAETWHTHAALLADVPHWRGLACLDAADSGPPAPLRRWLEEHDSVVLTLPLPSTETLRHPEGKECAGNMVNDRKDEDCDAMHSAVHMGSALRRLSACAPHVVERCRELGCGAVFSLRPDLVFTRPDAAALPALLLELELWPAVHVRFRSRCLNAGEWQAVAQRAAPPPGVAALPTCNTSGWREGGVPMLAPWASSEGYEPPAPCVPPRFSLDDNFALTHAAWVGSYFRTEWPLHTRRTTLACDGSHVWPEGRLTDALLAASVPVAEMTAPAFMSARLARNQAHNAQFSQLRRREAAAARAGPKEELRRRRKRVRARRG